MPFKTFVDVVLPLPLPNYFTYLLPPSMGQVEPGCRVLVPFGKRKFYSAIVVQTHAIPPADYQPKEVVELLDTHPILCRPQLRFWEWLSEYYICSVGDVYKAALPSALKLGSETVVSLNDGIDNLDLIPEKGKQIVALLRDGASMTVEQLTKQIPERGILSMINRLLDMEVLLLSEEVKRGFKPKQEPFVRLAISFDQEDTLKRLFDSLSRARSQLAILMAYLDLSNHMRKGQQKEVSKKQLIERSQCSNAVFNQLVDKGVFEVFHKNVHHSQFAGSSLKEASPLSDVQLDAFKEIDYSFREKNVTLLHGVTSSGKTEIYIHLIQEVLRQNKQVLYLVPEIALTTQLTERLKRVFGDKLGVYHSKYSDRERVEVWNDLLRKGDYQVILGVRSSIFLPFRNLGMIIVDEEHESSFKQQDPAPRYHARNAAIVLASMHGAKTLLGSATPSIETYYNAQTGKYGYVALTTRYAGMQMPEIIAVDTKELKRKRLMTGLFSPELIERITRALSRSEQVILFQNRRGFAPMMECKVCDWVPKCKHCDVSLTYHKGINQLVCHYCGSAYSIPRQCPACGSLAIPTRGFGTEQIEEEIQTMFPQAKVARMDLDTTRTRKAYSQLIHSFEQGKVDILIGTQMVSKGLDFERVNLVGVLSADGLLNFPDFRAHERAFQMLAQVSGRAGRKNRRGTVLIQTASPQHPILHQVRENDYDAMFNNQLRERETFRYPPFYRLIYIYMKHRDEETLSRLSGEYAVKLCSLFGQQRVLGPDKPIIGRIQSLYIKKVVLKIEAGASIDQVRRLIAQTRDEMLDVPGFSSLLIYYDVDPI
ncbi:MAG: primosomal protein N' [Bacteroidales bacterium]